MYIYNNKWFQLLALFFGQSSYKCLILIVLLNITDISISITDLKCGHLKKDAYKSMGV